MMITPTLLYAMAHRLETVGWVQGSFGTPNGPCCLLGTAAVCLGYHPYHLPYRAENELAAVLGLTRRLSVYNDDVRTTRNSIVRRLRRAAELLDAT